MRKCTPETRAKTLDSRTYLCLYVNANAMNKKNGNTIPKNRMHVCVCRTYTNDSNTNTSLSYYVLACALCFPFASLLISIFIFLFLSSVVFSCFLVAHMRFFFSSRSRRYHFLRRNTYTYVNFINKIIQSTTLSCIRMYSHQLRTSMWFVFHLI